MIFNNIEDVKRYMRFLRDSSQEGSKWFGDFNWFSSNNYTTTSEYFGELAILVEKLLKDNELRKHKCELLQLQDTIESYFK